MNRLLRKLLRPHSPSLGLVGTCRCRPCTRARNLAHSLGQPYTVGEWLAEGMSTWRRPPDE